ncbi:MAG: hypothetical protein RIT81_01015 [Deltaproteobacteria bacterium]
MNKAVPIYARKGGSESFYVPRFEVFIDDTEIPGDILYDVVSVSYKDKVDDIDGFDITINNFDAATGGFKYVGTPDGSKGRWFDPGRKIELRMGYGTTLRLMLRGQITSMTPNFPQSGAPSVKVSGLNELHELRKGQHTHAWFDEFDTDIAKAIGAAQPSKNRPGLGFPVRGSDGYQTREEREPYVFMHNVPDIVFLLQRARRWGYTLSIETDVDSGERYLRFGPSESRTKVTYALEYGSTLNSFQPTLSTVNQLEEVTVRSWDRKRAKPIEGKAVRSKLKKAPNHDFPEVAAAVKGRREVIHRPMRSKQEAKKLAESILRDTMRDLITGSGSTVGLPDLRAGSNIEIKGLGPRFSGLYFVTETTHTIDDSGYSTRFSARREEALKEAS